MNKHNVISLCSYKESKGKVENENICFDFMGSIKERISMTKLYATNFREYLEAMVKCGNIKQRFADNLNQQVDMIIAEFSSSK